MGSVHLTEHLLKFSIDIIEKLVSSRLRCFYCREKMKILYKNVRDSLQWTLDRKNNNQDHSNENTIIGNTVLFLKTASA